MDRETNHELEEILAQGVEVDDVTQKDHMLVIAIGFIPFIASLIWYGAYIS
ncbi:hypothetical protein MHB50_18310 [Siminovitchia sp. FSL H7-0308]|uniref:Cbb3-type cytochrome c oxidase subunit CcoP N-terminal domain-containing protein n=1 Tax=Siminovitchia thermophila TaxID=1245522 RepID=A0ABS2R764_9BACI|nr:hypothetical protein [Siminovitchia thermophila]MBM7715492.1 hypothetical protein [Siminovitchia thermophila]